MYNLILSAKDRKKSARFARTFSSRAARFARKNERDYGARPNGRRASRSILLLHFYNSLKI